MTCSKLIKFVATSRSLEVRLLKPSQRAGKLRPLGAWTIWTPTPSTLAFQGLNSNKATHVAD